MTFSVKDEATKASMKYLERVVGQALYEGATADAIVEWLRANGVVNPEMWPQRVGSKTATPLLGAIEIKNLGGRAKFRTLFGIAEPVKPPKKHDFPLTELGDAECFAKRYSDELRYDYRRGMWLIADEETGLWLHDSTERVITRAGESIRHRQTVALDIEDNNERLNAVKWTMAGESRSRMNNVLSLAQALPPIADDGAHWDERPYLLGVMNGVVDLTNGTVRRALPEERVSQQARVIYDPAAECPLWLATLAGVFRSDDPAESQRVIDFMQRALGYSITADCREECCFFAWGDGGNGKGTIFNTVGQILGDYRDDMPYATLEKNVHGGGIPNDIAKIAGKRFITCAEVNEFTLNESRLKTMTGRDPLTARFLNQEFFTFIPVGKIWIATNNKPRITGQDDGIWRRIHLIPFLNKFEGATNNKKLKDALIEEWPGILRWIVQGVTLWLEHGLNPPDSVRVATESYRYESDPLTPFVEQRCVLAANARAQAQALWSEYQQYAQTIEDWARLSDKAFYKSLKRRFKYTEGRQTTFIGIGVRDSHHKEERF
jgi:putative DNA primase/helicase